MRRQEVSFPLSFSLFLPAHPHRTIRAVFGPVGLRREHGSTYGAAFHLVPALADLGVQGTLEEGGEQMAGKSKYTFESKIHVYRATKRMTQQELADLVGVSRQTIMQLERNRYNPSMLLAYSIARVFDVTIEDLFDFKGA